MNMAKNSLTPGHSPIKLRPLRTEDGHGIHQLVAECPPLDPNSLYCNLLQCTHFAGTSVGAERDGKLVGFVTGYLIPERPNTLFIWQVAVSESARGERLGHQMMFKILQQNFDKKITHIETTITESNRASRAMFEGLAGKLKSKIEESVLFDRNRHFKNKHDSEILLRIGPF